LPATSSPGVIWPKDRTVRTADGADIAYTFLGPDDGPVVALCSGLLCPDTWWHHLAPALAEDGHRVLLFHYRGIATSSLPDDDHPLAFTIDRCAHDLHDILEAEGIERLTVLGHSMGVQVALEAFRLVRDRLDGLVAITGPFASPLRSLYEIGPVATYGVYHPGRILLGALPGPVRRAAWQAIWTHVPLLGIGKALRAFGPRTDDRLVESYFDHGAALDPAVALRIFAGMHEHDASDVLPELDIPTQIIAGAKDPLTPVSQARRMARLVEVDADLQVLPNATHGAILEYPEVIAGLVLDFLDRVAPAARAEVG
jgi:3-oxoadipate enol-lactonase